MSCFPVGDKGQRYEVHFKDRTTFEDRVFGWSNSEAGVKQMINSAALMPSALNPYVIARQEGPVCETCGNHMADDLPKRWRHCPTCKTWTDLLTNEPVSKAVVYAMHRFSEAIKTRREKNRGIR